jgi:DNA-binding protein YbaB
MSGFVLKTGCDIDPQVIEEEDGDMHEVAIVAAMCTKLNREAGLQ